MTMVTPQKKNSYFFHHVPWQMPEQLTCFIVAGAFFWPIHRHFLSISFSFYHSSTCDQIQSISESCRHSHRFGLFISSLFGTLTSVQNRCHDTFDQMPVLLTVVSTDLSAFIWHFIFSLPLIHMQSNSKHIGELPA